jgi:hypothetical protein
MEAESCGHTYMHPNQRCSETIELLSTVTVDEVKSIARELCEHVSHMQPEKGIKPVALIACAPVLDRDGMIVLIYFSILFLFFI